MPLSAAIFRRGGQKKELFEAVADDRGADEAIDDESELEVKLKGLQELLHTPKSGCAAAACSSLCVFSGGVHRGRPLCTNDAAFNATCMHKKAHGILSLRPPSPLPPSHPLSCGG